MTGKNCHQRFIYINNNFVIVGNREIKQFISSVIARSGATKQSATIKKRKSILFSQLPFDHCEPLAARQSRIYITNLVKIYENLSIYLI
jgi:hypothetical protein